MLVSCSSYAFIAHVLCVCFLKAIFRHSSCRRYVAAVFKSAVISSVLNLGTAQQALLVQT
jgi:hypothetical protein